MSLAKVIHVKVKKAWQLDALKRNSRVNYNMSFLSLEDRKPWSVL